MQRQGNGGALGETKDSAETPRPSGHGGVLQSAANIAVIVAALCVVLIAVQRLRPTVSEPLPTYAAGDLMDPLEGVNFGGAAQTLVMALREDCRFCRDSVPFYQELLAQEGTRKVSSQFVVVSTDPAASMAAYLKAGGLDVQHVVEYAPGALKIPATPTLLLINATGHVERVWRGRLAPNLQKEVFGALGIDRAD